VKRSSYAEEIRDLAGKGNDGRVLGVFCPMWIERRAKGGKVLYGLSGALGLFDKIRYPKRREDQTGNKEALILQREVA